MSETASIIGNYLDDTEASEPQQGCLYVVSTPIGNMGDITLRALRILARVDCIVAEDTRTSGNLLRRYDISTPSTSMHARNEKQRIPALLDRLQSGDSLAVISDAGTPGISDPAALLINAAVQAEIRVVPIPGASAALSALVVSGMHTDRFVFEGFLPVKKRRQTKIALLAEEERTVILYESVHRINRTLNDLLEVLGERQVCVAREITKLYEEIFHGSLSEALEHFSSKTAKGEYTLVLQGKNKE
jgi:16S rRNA (cytidine1402-2'-O)-methyltransferase